MGVLRDEPRSLRTTITRRAPPHPVPALPVESCEAINHLQAMPEPTGHGGKRVEVAMFHDGEEDCLGLIALKRRRAVGLYHDLGKAIRELWPNAIGEDPDVLAARNAELFACIERSRDWESSRKAEYRAQRDELLRTLRRISDEAYGLSGPELRIIADDSIAKAEGRN